LYNARHEKLMKRSYFFFLDKLKITASERKLIISLIILLMTLGLINSLTDNKEADINTTHYAELQAVLEERAVQIDREHRDKLKKYTPRKKITSDKPLTSKDAGQEAARAKEVKKNQITKQEKQVEHPAAFTGDEEVKININTATREELESLPGIGPVYARRIVIYREEKGRFKNPEELKNIKGIGPKRLEKLLPNLEMSAFNEMNGNKN